MRRALLAAALLSVFAAAPAWAQQRLFGTIRAEDGHPIKGATVTAENPNAAPSSLTATTDAKGRFGLIGIRSGTWTLTIQAPGFDTVRTQSSVTFGATSHALDIRMSASPSAGPATPLAGVDTAALQGQIDAASALEQAGRTDEAIAAWRQILARVPALTSLHLQIGWLLERDHDTAGALAEYRMLVAADPNNASARAAVDRLTGGA